MSEQRKEQEKPLVKLYVDAGEEIVTKYVTVPTVPPVTKIVSIPVTQIVRLTPGQALPVPTPSEEAVQEKAGEKGERFATAAARPPDYEAGDIPPEWIDQLEDLIPVIEELRDKLAKYIKDKYYYWLAKARKWVEDSKFVVEDYREREAKNITRDWVKSLLEEAEVLREVIGKILDELSKPLADYEDMDLDQLKRALEKRYNDLSKLLEEPAGYDPVTGEPVKFKDLPSTLWIREKVFSVQTAIKGLLSQWDQLDPDKRRQAAINVLKKADQTYKLAKQYIDVGISFKDTKEFAYFYLTTYEGVTLANLQVVKAKLKAAAPYLSKESYEALMEFIRKLELGFELGDRDLILEYAWVIRYVDNVAEAVRGKVDKTKFDENVTYYLEHPDEEPPPEAKARWKLDDLVDYVFLPGKVGDFVKEAFEKAAEKTGVEWLKYVGNVLGQATGWAAIALTFELIHLVSGGAATPMLIGAAFYQMFEDYVAYPYTDPVARDAINKFLKDLANKDPAAWSELVGMLAGLAVTVHIARKLPKVEVGGESLQLKISERMYNMFMRLSEQAYRRGNTFAAEVFRNAAGRYLKMGATKILEWSVEDMKVNVYFRQEGGKTWLVIEYLEKGRAEHGEMRLMPIDWTSIGMKFREAQGSTEAVALALKKLLMNKNAEEAKLVTRMVSDLAWLVKEGALKSKDAEALIKSLLRGEIEAPAILEIYNKKGIFIRTAEGDAYIYLRTKEAPLMYKIKVDWGKVKADYRALPVLEIEPAYLEAKLKTSTDIIEILKTYSSEEAFKFARDILGLTEHLLETGDKALGNVTPLVSILTENRNLVLDVAEHKIYSSAKGTFLKTEGQDLILVTGDELITVPASYERLMYISPDFKYVSKSVLRIQLPSAVPSYTTADLALAVRNAMKLLEEGASVNKVVNEIMRDLHPYIKDTEVLEQIAETIAKFASTAVERGLGVKNVMVMLAPDPAGHGSVMSVYAVTSASELGKMADTLTQAEAQNLLLALGERLGVSEEEIYSMPAEKLAKILGIDAAQVEIIRQKAQGRDLKVVEATVTDLTFIEVPAPLQSTTKNVYIEKRRKKVIAYSLPIERIEKVILTTRRLPAQMKSTTKTIYITETGTRRTKVDIPIEKAEVVLTETRRLPASVETVVQKIFEEDLKQVATDLELPIANILVEETRYVPLQPDVRSTVRTIYRENLGEISIRDNVETISIPIERLIEQTVPVYEEVYVWAGEKPPPGEQPPPPPQPVAFPFLPPGMVPAGTSLKTAKPSFRRGTQYEEVRL